MSSDKTNTSMIFNKAFLILCFVLFICVVEVIFGFYVYKLAKIDLRKEFQKEVRNGVCKTTFKELLGQEEYLKEVCNGIVFSRKDHSPEGHRHPISKRGINLPLTVPAPFDLYSHFNKDTSFDVRDTSSGARDDCPPGPPGLPGLPGSTGPKGAPGPKGDTGRVGPKGECGDEGSDGLEGEKGSIGEKGRVGEKGVVGPPGVPGIRGESGAMGAPGQKGELGVAGRNGREGVKGEPGIPGVSGKEGRPGSPGRPGIDGKEGKMGSPGEKGEPGINCCLNGKREIVAQ